MRGRNNQNFDRRDDDRFEDRGRGENRGQDYRGSEYRGSDYGRYEEPSYDRGRGTDDRQARDWAQSSQQRNQSEGQWRGGSYGRDVNEDWRGSYESNRNNEGYGVGGGWSSSGGGTNYNLNRGGFDRGYGGGMGGGYDRGYGMNQGGGSDRMYGGERGVGSFERSPMGTGDRGYGGQFDRDSLGYGGFDRGMYTDRDEQTRGSDRGILRSFGEGVKRAFGKGPKGYKRSDERIREDICDRLSMSDVDASDVEVLVRDGEVTLSGLVVMRGFKHRIEDIAESVPGVQDVTNNIRVKKEEISESRGGTSSTQPRDNNGKRASHS